MMKEEEKKSLPMPPEKEQENKDEDYEKYFSDEYEDEGDDEEGQNIPHPDYAQEILAITKSNLTPVIIRERLSDYHEYDIAEALALMNRDERVRIYSVLDSDTLADVMEYADDCNDYLSELAIKKRVEILTKLDIKTTSKYLEGLDKYDRKALLDLMPDDERRGVLFSRTFDDDQIGSYMTTNYIKIRTGCDVPTAMRELVSQAAENDNISTIYVVNENGTLVGAIDLTDLIVARRNTDLDSITATSYPYVYAHELIENCIDRIKDYCEDSIPVLDDSNVLQGILTAQDVTEIVNEELGEDYARLAGLSASEDLEEPVKMSVVKRFPWLMILLGLGLIVSSVVGSFEHVVEQLTLIVSFQSLVLDMAGNVGTQSLAVTIRVLMDERVSGREKAALIFKEGRVGLINGLIIGSLSFLFVGAYLALLRGQAVHMAFSVSFCTGVSLTVAMFFSAIIGTVTPIFFRKMGIDPAVASGPLITTLNDLIAVITYYGLAWILLINMLGLGT